MQLLNHAFFIPGTGFTQKMAFIEELKAQVKTLRARAVFYWAFTIFRAWILKPGKMSDGKEFT